MDNKNSKLKETLVYFISLCVFSSTLLWLFLSNDNYKKIKNPIYSEITSSDNFSIYSTFLTFLSELNKNFHHPLNLLLVQITIVLIASRIFSILFRRIGQPSVIGEICAGLALGPSLMGLFYPDFYKFIFPAPSLGNLQLLSQFGLIIFMFVVGMELDISVLKEKAKSAILISHISILFPFLLGCTLSLYFFDKYAPENISFLSFGLFLGIAMSITAFPVLARIIQEKGLSRSTVGIIALTCAAVDDISAWTVLALILAIIQAGSVHLIFFILFFSVIYISVMIYITQPVLEKMSKLYITKEIISRGVISILTILMLCSAMVSESLGIHALFGAFLAGVIMPTNTRLRGVITEKFEDFSAVLLLPLFFAYTGIRTRIQLLNTEDLWIDCIIVILIASIGKILGSLFAARFTGVSWRESTIIGFLMNTRGLMELVVLNIGYDMGILSPEIFTMFVIMALVTTLMTSPIISIFNKKTNDIPKSTPNKQVLNNKLLIAFGPPQSGANLFQIAYAIFSKNISYSAIHLSPLPEKVSLNIPIEKEMENFDPLLNLSKEKGLKVNTILRHTDLISNEINKTISNEQVDILFMGAAKTIFGDNAVGGKVESVLNETTCRSAIFIDKGFKEIVSLLIFYKYIEEAEIIFELGGMIQKNGTNDITLVYEKNNEPSEEKLRKYFHKGIKTISTDKQSKKIISRYSLLLVGHKHWIDMNISIKESIFNEKDNSNKDSNTSVLILKDGVHNFSSL